MHLFVALFLAPIIDTRRVWPGWRRLRSAGRCRCGSRGAADPTARERIVRIAMEIATESEGIGGSAQVLDCSIAINEGWWNRPRFHFFPCAVVPSEERELVFDLR